MSKTILLGTRMNISVKASKWIALLAALIYLSIGTTRVLQEGLSFYGGGNILLGLVIGVYALLIFSVTRFSPRVAIEESGLELRSKLFGKTTHINWQDVASIDFDRYEIHFNLKSGSSVFSYETNSATSIEIKKSIREIAEQKGIEIGA